MGCTGDRFVAPLVAMTELPSLRALPVIASAPPSLRAHPRHCERSEAISELVILRSPTILVWPLLLMNPVSKQLYVVFLLMAVLAVPAARADWINLTGSETAPNIAEIYVLDDRVHVKLEVYVGDLDKFADLVPDDWLRDASGRESLEERLERFSREGLQFVTDAGEQLIAEVVTIEPRLRVDRQSPFAGMINPITRARVPDAPADKRVLYVELDYPFEGKPGSLEFIPPLDEDGNIASATIGFIAYHKSVPVIDFRYLGAPAHLTLDWSDPWYSKFKNVNLKRHHASALMTFLYVEPYEVRHEILTRVKDLEEWMDLGLRGDEFIEIDELEPLKQRIGEFMMSRNPVLIDGEAVDPILDRTNYVTVGIKGIQILEVPERLEISTAIVGVILTYITDGIPQEVTVDWELFTDQVQRVPATSTDPAGPLPTYVTADDNVHTWTNYLKNYTLPTVETVAVAGSIGQLEIPVASAGGGALLLLLLVVIASRRKHGASLRLPAIAAGVLVAASAAAWPFARVSVDRPTALAGTLETEQSVALVETVLRNVYRAFDFREEDDVYDKLALVVSGDLLADIYLQSRQSLAVQQAGGAQAKVKELEIREAIATRRDEGDLGYDIRAQWTAMGTVGHWGHTHIRQNLYDAILTVESIDGVWKITGMEVLEETRIDPNAPATAATAP